MAAQLPDVNQILSMDDIRRLWRGYIRHIGISPLYITRSFYLLHKDRDEHFESFLNMLERHGYMLDNLYEEMNTPPDDSYEKKNDYYMRQLLDNNVLQILVTKE